MNVLFVHSLQDIHSAEKPIHNYQYIQFGISYISSLLKTHGHTTRLLVLTRETNFIEIEKHIQAFKPKIIFFSIVFSEYAFIAKIAKYLKNRFPDVFLLAGGPHITLNPEECISADFDAICIGEGEYPALELINKLEKGELPLNIANLWIKNNGVIEKNTPRPFLENLDSLPFPDREMWKPWVADLNNNYSILLGRGCPFQCSYCCNHAFKKIAAGKYVRLRSIANIIKELQSIKINIPTVKNIFFEVETIAIDKNFALGLAEKLKDINKGDSRMAFGTNIRITPNANLEEILISFKDCGFKSINIGVESGSEKIRSEILKRNYTNDDIIKTVNLARKLNLEVSFYNLIGIPGETLKDFKETIKINRKCLPDRYSLSIFFPYPGTDLYIISKNTGLINRELDIRMERSRAILNMPQFSAKQIQHNYIWFDYNVYRGKKPLHKILTQVILAKIKTSYKLNFLSKPLINNKTFRLIKKCSVNKNLFHMQTISVAIVAKNEENNIEKCLNSVKWADEIIIVDMFSTDKTVQIAKKFTDKIYSYYDYFIDIGKNFAFEKAGCDWVLSLDADEIITDNLHKEIIQVINSNSLHNGFFIPFKHYFMNRWMEHGGWYPSHIIRLFKKSCGKYTVEGAHQLLQIKGSIGYLMNPVIHTGLKNPDIFSKKHSLYSTMIAKAAFSRKEKVSFRKLFIRPPYIFIKRYIFQLGFLDGIPGLILMSQFCYYLFLEQIKLFNLYKNDKKTHSFS